MNKPAISAAFGTLTAGVISAALFDNPLVFSVYFAAASICVAIAGVGTK